EDLDADLLELTRLVETLGLEVVGRVTQKRSRLRAGTALGLGKLKELARLTGGSGVVEPHVPGRKKQRGSPEPDEDEVEDDAGAEVPPQKAEVVVIDHELSPRVQHNLERATGAEVLDRSHVIVEIFHRHAKSREARLQV